MVVLLWALSSGCFFFMVQSDDKINRNHHIFYVNTKKNESTSYLWYLLHKYILWTCNKQLWYLCLSWSRWIDPLERIRMDGQKLSRIYFNHTSDQFLTNMISLSYLGPIGLGRRRRVEWVSYTSASIISMML